MVLKETDLSLFLENFHWIFNYLPTTSHNDSSCTTVLICICKWLFVLRIENTQKNLCNITLRGWFFPYLQSSVWRILPALVFSKHSARPPAQAMRQDWSQVACLCQERQQQGLCALKTGNTFVRCSVGVLHREPTKFRKIPSSCFERDRDVELLKSHFTVL